MRLRAILKRYAEKLRSDADSSLSCANTNNQKPPSERMAVFGCSPFILRVLPVFDTHRSRVYTTLVSMFISTKLAMKRKR